jgi:hypothetical protein
MPPYIGEWAVWRNIWPPIIGAGVVALLISSLALLRNRRSVEEGWFWTLYAFSLLGFVSGLLTGHSRAPAVGAVLPGILTLVGGLAIYLTANKGGLRVLVSAAVISLSVSLWVGAMWGAILREEAAAETTGTPRQRDFLPPVIKPPGEPGESPIAPMPLPGR